MTVAQWTTLENIKSLLLKKWDRGCFLKSAFLQDDFFPLYVPLKAPTTKDFASLPEILAWQQKLKNYKLFSMTEKSFHSKIHGQNTWPVGVTIETLEDGVQILHKQGELQRFLENASALMADYPSLEAWIGNHTLKVLELVEVESLLLAVHWFVESYSRPVFVREISIPGLHTKFIEKNKGILSELLAVILPKERLQPEARTFEERFYLKREPQTVRFRMLDAACAVGGMLDIKTPISEFSRLRLSVKTVYFTENLTNFLTFPPRKDACVIFAKGFFVELLQSAAWLQEKNLYYWGDLDTHGFHILSMAKKHFPKLESILMTEEIFLAHKDLWVKEEKPFLGQANYLTTEELALLTKLQHNFYGENLRLEQEFVDFSWVENTHTDIKI